MDIEDFIVDSPELEHCKSQFMPDSKKQDDDTYAGFITEFDKSRIGHASILCTELYGKEDSFNLQSTINSLKPANQMISPQLEEQDNYNAQSESSTTIVVC